MMRSAPEASDLALERTRAPRHSVERLGWRASHNHPANSSVSISASLSILLKSPGPIVSPACIGTTERRPSECCKKWWLPLIRKTLKPARRNAAMTSRPRNRGKRGILRP